MAVSYLGPVLLDLLSMYYFSGYFRSIGGVDEERERRERSEQARYVDWQECADVFELVGTGYLKGRWRF